MQYEVRLSDETEFECETFQELAHGVRFNDEEGDLIAYFPYEHVIAVAFADANVISG